MQIFKKKFKKGQAVLESILILVVSILLLSLFISNLGSGERSFLRSVVAAPAERIRGMARSGVWVEYKSNKDLEQHPNLIQYHVMNKGESVK